jgi:ABC-type antimicrobial peptide transport system permease subunit
MGTIGLLLSIACANVANLVRVRTESRRPELAIRTALGAGWTAIARVVFAESAVLGLAGGAAGLAIAYVTLPLLLSIGGSDLPDVMLVSIDPTVVLVTVGTSALAILTFALIPVLHFRLPGRRIADAQRGGARSVTGGPAGNRRDPPGAAP